MLKQYFHCVASIPININMASGEDFELESPKLSSVTNNSSHRSCPAVLNNSSEIIHLNVGGVPYMTTATTLKMYPDSMLGAMFRSDMEPMCRDRDGSYFIDRDGHMFKYVLSYLRSGRLSLPREFNQFDALQDEADFYQIQGLQEAVRKAALKYGSHRLVRDHVALDFIDIQMIYEKRYSGSNLRNTDGTTAFFAVETAHLIICGLTANVCPDIVVLMKEKRSGEGEEAHYDVDKNSKCATMVFKKYSQYNMTKFRSCHLEHRGVTTNLKILVTTKLSKDGWALSDSSHLSGTYGNADVSSNIFTAEYRERWTRPVGWTKSET